MSSWTLSGSVAAKSIAAAIAAATFAGQLLLPACLENRHLEAADRPREDSWKFAR